MGQSSTASCYPSKLSEPAQISWPPTRPSCSKTNVLRPSFPHNVHLCSTLRFTTSPQFLRHADLILPNPRIFSSPCIGGQNLSPAPLPPCLQWLTPFLPSWLRRGSRIPGCPSPCARQAAAAPAFALGILSRQTRSGGCRRLVQSPLAGRWVPVTHAIPTLESRDGWLSLARALLNE